MLPGMRLYGVRKLAELEGRFYVHVRCRACGHGTSFLAADLERKVPLHQRLDADLDTVKERFVCRCGARSPWVWSMTDPME